MCFCLFLRFVFPMLGLFQPPSFPHRDRRRNNWGQALFPNLLRLGSRCVSITLYIYYIKPSYFLYKYIIYIEITLWLCVYYIYIMCICIIEIYIYVCVCILVVRSSSGYFSSSRFRPLKWAWHHGMGLGRTCRYYSYSSSSWIFHVCVIAAAARRVRLGVRRARFGRRFLLDLKHCRRHVYRIIYIDMIRF